MVKDSLDSKELTPTTDPDTVIGKDMITKLSSMMFFVSYLFLLPKFEYIEAIEPPIRKIQVIAMLSFAPQPRPNMRQMLRMGPPPIPAAQVTQALPVRVQQTKQEKYRCHSQVLISRYQSKQSSIINQNRLLHLLYCRRSDRFFIFEKYPFRKCDHTDSRYDLQKSMKSSLIWVGNLQDMKGKLQDMKVKHQKTFAREEKKDKRERFRTNDTLIDQSFVQEFQDPLNYNLKQHQFNQLDYTLQNWIDRRFTFQDIKKDYLRVVNGPTNRRTLKKSRQPFVSKQSMVAQIQENQSFFDNQSMSQSAIQFLQESEMEIKSYNDFYEQPKPQSVIEIESSDDANAVHVEQDSQQLYFVPLVKKKAKNIDLQSQQLVEAEGPKLTNLLLETLRQKNKKGTRKNFAKGKLQYGQIKRNTEVPQQLCIKLDD